MSIEETRFHISLNSFDEFLSKFPLHGSGYKDVGIPVFDGRKSSDHLTQLKREVCQVSPPNPFTF